MPPAPTITGQTDHYTAFRKTMLKKHEKNLQKLRLSDKQKEELVMNIYTLGQSFIRNAIEKNII